LITAANAVRRLHGHLASILSLATNAKKPLGESGFFVESVKLVAGARNTRFLRLVERVIPKLAELDPENETVG
jgi:site-specific DNA recombinase